MSKTIQNLLKVAAVLGMAGLALYMGVFLVTGRYSVTFDEFKIGVNLSDNSGRNPFDFFSQIADDIEDASRQNGWNQSNQDLDPNRNKINQSIDETYASISSINISVSMGEIEVLPAKDNSVRLVVTTYGSSTADVKVENGALNVDVLCTVKNCKNNAKSDIIKLYIPSNLILENSIIKNDMGDVDIKAGEWKNTKFILNMGDLDLERVTVRGLTAEMAMGDFDLKGTAYDVIEVNNSMGEIDVELTNNKDKVSYVVDTSMGEIKIDDRTIEEKNMGAKAEETMNNPECSLQLINNMGDINLEFYK